MASFDCKGIAPQLVAKAQQDYAASTSRSDRPVAMAGYYSWAYSSSEYVCTSGGTWSFTEYWAEAGYVSVHGADGTPRGEYYHDIGIQTVYVPIQTCGWVDIFIGTWHGDTNGDEPPPPPDGGGGGGGGGDDPPPPPPPPSADTCPVTQDALGPLTHRSMQDSLNAILVEAINSHQELGGYIYQVYANGPFHIARLTSDMPSNCSFTFTGGGQAMGHIVAYFHTHLYADGEEYSCPGDEPGTHRTARPLLTGGGSLQDPDNPRLGDWGVARSTGVPMYTVDPDNFWRLDPTVQEGQELNNQNKWDRVPGGCAIQ